MEIKNISRHSNCMCQAYTKLIKSQQSQLDETSSLSIHSDFSQNQVDKIIFNSRESSLNKTPLKEIQTNLEPKRQSDLDEKCTNCLSEKSQLLCITCQMKVCYTCSWEPHHSHFVEVLDDSQEKVRRSISKLKGMINSINNVFCENETLIKIFEEKENKLLNELSKDFIIYEEKLLHLKEMIEEFFRGLKKENEVSFYSKFLQALIWKKEVEVLMNQINYGNENHKGLLKKVMINEEKFGELELREWTNKRKNYVTKIKTNLEKIDLQFIKEFNRGVN